MEISAEIDDKKGLIDQEKIKSVYGSSINNWGDLTIFQGNFINFGYWKDFPLTDASLTMNQRVESSLSLYLQVAKYLNILDTQNVLEIGCGRGVGAAHLYRQYSPNNMVGIDITPEQIEQAIQYRKNCFIDSHALQFIIQDAEKTGFNNNSFDKIYAVESVQHMASITSFAYEMRRILKKGGRLVITTFIPTGSVPTDHLEKLIPFFEEHLDNPTPIDLFKQAFVNAGFSAVDIHCIGQHVFPGYIKWARQVSAENEGTYNFLTAYNLGMIDYYIVVIR